MDDFSEVDFSELGEVDSAGGDRPANSFAPRKKGFTNPVFPNDSVTVCPGFLNAVKAVEKNSRTLYFVRVGIIHGSKQEEDGYVGDITNCDLLVGDTLGKWVQGLLRSNDSYDGVRMRFTIRNLRFTADIYDGKPVLRSRGILESVAIGHLG